MKLAEYEMGELLRMIRWITEEDAPNERNTNPGFPVEILRHSDTYGGLVGMQLKQLVDQPWVVSCRNKTYVRAKDREALLDWLEDCEVLTHEQRLMLDAQKTLELIE